MNTHKKTLHALHIFMNTAPHLSTIIIPRIKTLFPSHSFAIYEITHEYPSFIKGNQMFIRLAEDNYFGRIRQNFIQRFFRETPGIGALFKRLLPDLALLSFLKLLFGPRIIILHGRLAVEFNLLSLLFLRLFRKRIYVIHWAGKPCGGRFFGPFDRLTYRLFSHIFVLMSPELRYFKPLVGERVSCLPYFSTKLESLEIHASTMGDTRKLLLGNSANCRESYCEILERLNPKDWDKITCMLNYGAENTKTLTDAFVRHYQVQFGDTFHAWQTTLPLNEYKKVLTESRFYICASKIQTGLGAISTAIRQGKTLILRGDNFKWIHSLGVKVYDYDTINDFSFEALEKLLLSKEEAEHSLHNYNKNFILTYTPQHWATTILSAISHD